MARLRGLADEHSRSARLSMKHATSYIRRAKTLIASGRCESGSTASHLAAYAAGEMVADARHSGSRPLLKAALKIARSARKLQRKLAGVCIRD